MAWWRRKQHDPDDESGWLELHVPRHIVWRVFTAILAPILILITIVLLFLASESGTRFAINKGLSIYNGMIPGHIGVARVSGSLLYRLDLRGVSITDDAKREMVRAERVGVALDFFSLAFLDLQFSSVFVADAHVTLRNKKNGESAFLDLAPPSDADVEEEDDGEVLPLHLGADRVVITNASLSIVGDHPKKIVNVFVFDAAVEAEGSSVWADISELEANVPPADLSISDMALSGRMDGPRIRIHHADAYTNYGTLDIDRLMIDIMESDADGSLRARIFHEKINRMMSASIDEDLPLTVELSAADERISLHAVSFSGVAGLDLLASARTIKPYDADLSMAIVRLRPEPLGSPLAGTVSGTLDASATGDTLQTLHGDIKLSLPDMQFDEIGRASLKADLRYSTQQIEGNVYLAAADADLDVMGSYRDSRISGEWALSVPKLSTFTRAFDVQGIAGAVSGSGTCEGPLKNLNCDGTLQGDSLEFPGGKSPKATIDMRFATEPDGISYAANLDAAISESGALRLTKLSAKAEGSANAVSFKADLTSKRQMSAHVAGRVAFIEPLEITLNTLESDLIALPVRLTHPATARISTELVDIDLPGLLLADGRLKAWAKLTPSDISAHARLRGFELRDAAMFTDLPQLSGTLFTEVNLAGTVETPYLQAHVNVEELSFGDQMIGDTDLTAIYDDQMIDLNAHMKHPNAFMARVRARAPLGYSAENGFSYDPQAHHNLDWLVVKLESEQVEDLLDLPPSLRFKLDSRGHMEGSLYTLSGTSTTSSRFSLQRYDNLAMTMMLDMRSGNPELDLEISGNEKIAVKLYSKAKLNIPQLMEGRLSISRLSVFASLPDEGRISSRGRWLSGQPPDLDIDLKDLNLSLINAFKPYPKVTGVLDLNLRSGFYDKTKNSRLHLHAATRGLVIRERNIGEVTLDADLEPNAVTLNLQLRDASHALATLRGRVPVQVGFEPFSFNWLRDDEHEVTLSLHDLDDSHLTPFVDLPKQTDFKVNGRIDLKGGCCDLKGDGSFTGYLAYDDSPKNVFDARLKLSPKKQSIDVTIEEGAANTLKLYASTKLDVTALIDGQADLGSLPILIDIDSKKLDMEAFSVFMPTVVQQIEGDLTTRLTFDGTPMNPSLKGHLNIENGNMAVLMLTSTFQDIALTLEAKGRSFDITRLYARSGGGSVNMTGSISAEKDRVIEGDAEMTFDDFPIAVRGLPKNRLDAKLDLDMRVDDSQTKIDAALSDTTLYITINTTSAPQDIPKNQNLVYVDERNKDKGPSLFADIFKPVVIDTRLTEPMIVTGATLDTQWTGQVLTRLKEKGPTLEGSISLTYGNVDFLGNEFRLEQALLTFDPLRGAIPYISLKAVSNLPEARVVMTLRGPAVSPELHLSSQPSMSEYQIFTLLVTGTTETSEENRKEVSSKAANMGAGLIAYKMPALQRQFQNHLGIDRVAVAFGDTVQEPILMVGKRVSRGVYVQTSYHHNAPPDENLVEGKVELVLAPHWMLETFYGDANVAGLDVFWHTAFGKPESKDENLDAMPPVPDGDTDLDGEFATEADGDIDLEEEPETIIDGDRERDAQAEANTH